MSCSKSNNIIYTGPNLPCTGINANDTLTDVIKRLSDTICSPSTTTSTSTTTTTTTVCARPVGLHTAKLLFSFDTQDNSSCDDAVYNIRTTLTVANACAMWTALKDCFCPGFPHVASYADVEYASLTIGEKVYFGLGTHCILAPNGHYFLWDSTTIGVVEYFCPLETTTVTIVTIDNEGKISAIDMCPSTTTTTTTIAITTTTTSLTTSAPLVNVYTVMGSCCSGFFQPEYVSTAAPLGPSLVAGQVIASGSQGALVGYVIQPGGITLGTPTIIAVNIPEFGSVWPNCTDWNAYFAGLACM